MCWENDLSLWMILSGETFFLAKHITQKKKNNNRIATNKTILYKNFNNLVHYLFLSQSIILNLWYLNLLKDFQAWFLKTACHKYH